MDLPGSGAVEAQAGAVDPPAFVAKMAHALNELRLLQDT